MEGSEGYKSREVARRGFILFLYEKARQIAPLCFDVLINIHICLCRSVQLLDMDMFRR